MSSNEGTKRPIEYEIGDLVDKNLKHYLNMAYKEAQAKKKHDLCKAQLTRVETELKDYKDDYYEVKRMNQKHSKSIDSLLGERGDLRGQVSKLERKVDYLHNFYQDIIKEKDGAEPEGV